jgi:AcrR family transcriptional regulator
MTKKKPKHERMQAIVRAALDEFLEKGYEGASMDAIAARAGLSKGGLYHHFQSKDDILLYANEIIDRPLALLRKRAAAQASARKALYEYMDKYLEYWQHHQREMVFYSLSMTKIMDNPELRRMYAGYAEKLIALFEDIYRRGIDSGEFRPHYTRESALAFVAALDGVVFYTIMSDKIKPSEILTAFSQKFIDCLAVQNEGQPVAGGKK